MYCWCCFVLCVVVVCYLLGDYIVMINLKNIEIGYGNYVLILFIDGCFVVGLFIVIIGVNGVGKFILFKILVGL